MAKLTAKQLEKHLKARSHDDLVLDILELFRRLEAVRDFYQFRLDDSHNEELLDRCKAQIKKEFFPKRGLGRARLSVARKVITEYAQVSNSVEGQADLMLYYVEMGVKYTNKWGEINDAFYNSMEKMYEQACELIAKEDMPATFAARCEKIVKAARSVGWGFHENLEAAYHQHIKPE
ncbi:MAG: hypothetical protein JXB07_11760 [Anaerolineae bacterium]|nr:hypothetical protein [Anaerolineae bacterium]